MMGYMCLVCSEWHDINNPACNGFAVVPPGNTIKHTGNKINAARECEQNRRDRELYDRVQSGEITIDEAIAIVARRRDAEKEKEEGNAGG